MKKLSIILSVLLVLLSVKSFAITNIDQYEKLKDMPPLKKGQELIGVWFNDDTRPLMGIMSSRIVIYKQKGKYYVNECTVDLEDPKSDGKQKSDCTLNKLKRNGQRFTLTDADFNYYDVIDQYGFLERYQDEDLFGTAKPIIEDNME